MPCKHFLGAFGMALSDYKQMEQPTRSLKKLDALRMQIWNSKSENVSHVAEVANPILYDGPQDLLPEQ